MCVGSDFHNHLPRIADFSPLLLTATVELATIIAMPEFSLTSEIHETPRVVIVRTSGYIDDNAGEKIKKIVQSMMEKGEKNFLFSFGGSPVINSTGIACIIEICEDISFTMQGKVAFCCLSNTIAEVFRMMGIVNVYQIFEQEESALKAFLS